MLKIIFLKIKKYYFDTFMNKKQIDIKLTKLIFGLYFFIIF